MNEIDYSRLSQLGGWDSSVGDGRTPEEIEDDERWFVEEMRRVEDERAEAYIQEEIFKDRFREENEFNWKLEGF